MNAKAARDAGWFVLCILCLCLGLLVGDALAEPETVVETEIVEVPVYNPGGEIMVRLSSIESQLSNLEALIYSINTRTGK